jgi:DNA-binding NtrC family response regulator
LNVQQAQIVHHGLDERLTESLRAFALHQGLHLREVASLKALLPLLAKHADASILVVQLGEHLERELALLEQVSAVVPQTAVVALLGLGNPLLAGLAGELGATVVLTPPHVKDRLEEVLLKLVTAQQAGRGSR